MNVCKVSIIDFLNIIFLTIIFIFYLTVINITPHKIVVPFVFLVVSLLIAINLYIRKKHKSNNWNGICIFISTILFLFILFETFYMILPYFNINRYDQLMVDIDYFIFGVHPTVWLQSLHSKWLTELLFILYLFYFPMPLFILIWLYINREYKKLEQALFNLLFCYYMSYIIYFLVPVVGPRFFQSDLHTEELQGIILSKPIYNLINLIETNKFDAFPSLHIAILLITMVITYKHNKKMFIYFVPIAIGILFSLVYLRYHYVIDVIAGALSAIISLILSNYIFKKYNFLFHSHFMDR